MVLFFKSDQESMLKIWLLLLYQILLISNTKCGWCLGNCTENKIESNGNGDKFRLGRECSLFLEKKSPIISSIPLERCMQLDRESVQLQYLVESGFSALIQILFTDPINFFQKFLKRNYSMNRTSLF